MKWLQIMHEWSMASEQSHAVVSPENVEKQRQQEQKKKPAKLMKQLLLFVQI